MTAGIIVADEISKLLDGGENRSQRLEGEALALAERYAKEVEGLSGELRLFAFRNVIMKRGNCGFASGGANDYLVNTDGSRRYRVTVRTYWTQGINSGQYDRVHISEAGGQLYLGCTDSGAIPVAYYNRSVVGEVAV